jgi:hypothetical protein
LKDPLDRSSKYLQNNDGLSGIPFYPEAIQFEDKKKSGESEGPESSLSEIWNKTGGEKNAVTVQPFETGLTGEIFSSC